MKKERTISKKTSQMVSIIAVSVTVFFACLFFWKLFSVINGAKTSSGQYVILSSLNRDAFLKDGLIDSKDVLAGNTSGKILLSDEDVQNKAEITAWGDKALIKYEVSRVAAKDLIVLEFTAFTENETPIPVSISCGNSLTNIWVYIAVIVLICLGCGISLIVINILNIL